MERVEDLNNQKRHIENSQIHLRPTFTDEIDNMVTVIEIIHGIKKL